MRPPPSRLTYNAVTAAAKVANRRGLRLRVLSRSDSTLRGHFATEIRRCSRRARRPRTSRRAARSSRRPSSRLDASPPVTRNGCRWTEVSCRRQRPSSPPTRRSATPRTTWSRGPTAASGPRLREPTTSISLDALRSRDGVHRVAAAVRALDGAQVAVANAVRAADLESTHARPGRGRTGGPTASSSAAVPSLVRVCAGQAEAGPVASDVVPSAVGHGLIAVGSHTDLTNSQVEVAVADAAAHCRRARCRRSTGRRRRARTRRSSGSINEVVDALRTQRRACCAPAAPSCTRVGDAARGERRDRQGAGRGRRRESWRHPAALPRRERRDHLERPRVRRPGIPASGRPRSDCCPEPSRCGRSSRDGGPGSRSSSSRATSVRQMP